MEDAPATANKCIFRYKRHVIHRRRIDALLTKTRGQYDQKLADENRRLARLYLEDDAPIVPFLKRPTCE
jgi:hypothetical protein